MGVYLNPSCDMFQKLRQSRFFVDKTDFLAAANRAIETGNNRICISRPRRIGKTALANMLTAYYSRGGNADALFQGLAIQRDSSYARHRSAHNVISLDIASLRLAAGEKNTLTDFIREQVRTELAAEYPDAVRDSTFPAALTAIARETGSGFVFVLDEWDVVFREDRDNGSLQKTYIQFLQELFQDSGAEQYLDLVLLIGILPIPEGAVSAGLDQFQTSTMLHPEPHAAALGFASDEVKELCNDSAVSYRSIRRWYDGYHMSSRARVYCPYSVLMALGNETCKPYWPQTSAETELAAALDTENHILRELITLLAAGQSVPMESPWLHGEDSGEMAACLTQLLHLGYLNFNRNGGTLRIPNREIAEDVLQLLQCSRVNPFGTVLRASGQLLQEVLRENSVAVAEGVQAAHNCFRVCPYSSQPVLAAALTLAFHPVSDRYDTWTVPSPAESGSAAVLLLPKRRKEIPIAVELLEQGAEGGILQQIQAGQSLKRLSKYPEVLLAEIRFEGDPWKLGYQTHSATIRHGLQS